MEAEGAGEDVSDHVLIVLGHRDPAIFERHLLGSHGVHRVRHAEDVARRGGYRAVILTGTGAAGADSEARQMAQLWSDPSTPLILEEQSNTTAENAAYCLPLILKMQGVRRVTVVSCNWHVRAKYFFAEYHRFGIDVSFDSVDDGARNAASYLVGELKACRHMRRQRRSAYRKAGISGMGPSDGHAL